MRPRTKPRRWLVTGVSSGLGRALAAQEGMAADFLRALQVAQAVLPHFGSEGSGHVDVGWWTRQAYCAATDQLPNGPERLAAVLSGYAMNPGLTTETAFETATTSWTTENTNPKE